MGKDKDKKSKKGKEKKEKEKERKSKHKHKKDEKKHRKEREHKKDKKKHHHVSEEGESEEESITNEGRRVLGKDDYYREQKKFKVWLYLSENLSFEALQSSDEAFAYFEKYVKLWNKGKLNEKFYFEGDEGMDNNLNGFSQDLIAKCNQTNHQWNFAANLTPDEMDAIESHNIASFGPTFSTKAEQVKSNVNMDRYERDSVQSITKMDKEKESYEQITRENVNENMLNGKVRKRYGYSLEELNELEGGIPREARSHRDKINDQRAHKNYITHAAHKYEMDNIDGCNLIPDTEIYSQGDSVLEKDKAKLRAEEERRQKQLNDYEAEEKAKVDAILQSVGVKRGSKIEMKKR